MALILFLGPLKIHRDFSRYLIVWNVGQGSWSTLVNSASCLHFDIGGETFPSQIKALCQKKKNEIYLSHDDWDHISFIARLKNWPHLCLSQMPRAITSRKKEELLISLPICPPTQDVMELLWPIRGHHPNDLSRIYVAREAQALFPGDSPRSQEKFWAQQLKLFSIKWWVLGHHGSVTSNSKFIYNEITPLAAISSSRWRKYHHPHPRVVAELRVHGIPLLKTEDWGHLWIEL